MIEDGVDFVLDPANNTIKFRDKSQCVGDCWSNSRGDLYSTPLSAFQAQLKYSNQFDHYTILSVQNNQTNYLYTYKTYDGLPIYYIQISHVNAEEKLKTIPITSLASQVITQAEKDDAEAKAYVSTVAQDLLEHDEDVQKAVVAQADDSQKDSEDQPVSVPSTSGNSTNATPPPDDEDDSAYNVAKNGGKDSGFYKNNLERPTNELQKGIRSLQKQIDNHRALIKNPKQAMQEQGKGDWTKLDPRQQKALLEKKWPSDIQRQMQQKSILEGILKNRGEL